MYKDILNYMLKNDFWINEKNLIGQGNNKIWLANVLNGIDKLEDLKTYEILNQKIYERYYNLQKNGFILSLGPSTPNKYTLAIKNIKDFTKGLYISNYEEMNNKNPELTARELQGNIDECKAILGIAQDSGKKQELRNILMERYRTKRGKQIEDGDER